MLSALTIGQIAEIGSLTALLGILITFIVFVILLMVLAAIQKAIRLKLFVKENPMPTMEDAQDDLEEHELINNSSVVAAITAAIAVIIDNEKKPLNKSKANFVVKSIKRI